MIVMKLRPTVSNLLKRATIKLAEYKKKRKQCHEITKISISIRLGDQN